MAINQTMWRQQKHQFVWDAFVGGTISLQPQGASSPPIITKSVHPRNPTDFPMHTSVEPSGHVGPSISRL